MNLVNRNHRHSFPNSMDEFFKDWTGGSQLHFKTMPPVNIRETAKNFQIELIAPGLKKEDFSIEIDKNVLTISSEVKAEKMEQEEGKFTRKEYSHSSFKRAFTLPETVEADAINAGYEDGILKLTLPKKEEALPKAKRSIEIS